jgi:hypothetical protein
LGTIARSINGLGAIEGYYTDASNVNHGFVRNLDGNNAIDALGFVERSSIASTRPETIAGYYSDSDGLPHAFVRDGTGSFSTPNVPGGSYGSVATIKARLLLV